MTTSFVIFQCHFLERNPWSYFYSFLFLTSASFFVPLLPVHTSTYMLRVCKLSCCMCFQLVCLEADCLWNGAKTFPPDDDVVLAGLCWKMQPHTVDHHINFMFDTPQLPRWYLAAITAKHELHGF